MAIDFRVKTTEFDRERVRSAVGKVMFEFMGHFGGWVKQTAKRSIRDARNPKDYAPPGKPPRSHEGTLKRGILYELDPDANSVVIGPAKDTNKQNVQTNILEYGGKERITKIVKEKKWKRPGTSRNVTRTQVKGWYERDEVKRPRIGRLMRVSYNVIYEARPYMKPVFEKALKSPKFRKMLKDAATSSFK